VRFHINLFQVELVFVSAGLHVRRDVDQLTLRANSVQIPNQHILNTNTIKRWTAVVIIVKMLHLITDKTKINDMIDLPQ
jgi:hypothetical protein